MNKWRFTSNNNAGDRGINDAGIETFSKDCINSLVRESIQNSLDAKIVENNDPVEVQFNLFEIPVTSVPDYKGLREAIDNCYKSNLEDADAKIFFERAKKVLESDTISVLRISDINTVGLEGSEKPYDRYTNWYGLIKKEGSSNNKNGTSGGSFGIGKNAYFGASDLRTVFFTSLNEEMHSSNIGLAKLISFNAGEYWTTGKGFFSSDNKFVPIEEILRLDPNYNRTTTGTDIYVIGMNSLLNKEHFKMSVIRYVLLNFFVSIWTEQLIVKVQDEHITKDNIEIFVNDLDENDDNDVKNMKEYYYLLTSQEQVDSHKIELDSKEFGSKYGIKDGECILYVKKSNESKLNRRILMTRKTGMRLFEKDRINGYIQFTGIMHIVGDNMNRIFRKMEVASHDAWEPGRCRDKEKEYRKIRNEFYSYINKKVNDLIKEDVGKEVEAFNVGNFIKDFTDTGKEELRKDELSTNVSKIEVKRINQAEVKKENALKEVNVTDAEDTPGAIKKLKHNSEGEINKPAKDAKEDPHGDEKGYKETELSNQILIGIDSRKGIFVYRFRVPKTSRFGKLEFEIVGEQQVNTLNVKDARITMNTSAKMQKVEKNKVYLSNLKQNELVEVTLNIDFYYNCTLRVRYYEGK